MRQIGALLCLLSVALLTTAAGTWPPHPVTIYVGAPHSPSKVYGPADMLCDLYTCRLFNLPKESELPQGAIVQFGLPQLNGQDRVDIRRCFQVCRATVLGYEATPPAPATPGNPTIAITPVEMRLE